MNNKLLADLNISKLTLGTVQFGIPYGIANTSGMPNKKQVTKIIAAAFEGGVTTLDTAAAYGASEKVIGEVLDDLMIKERVTVVTKVPSVKSDTTPREVGEAFEAALEKSIKLLKIDPLPLVLLHDESNITFLEQLESLKQKGMVKHIGVSVQYTDWGRRALDTCGVEAIQWPGSLLDTRFERARLYQKAQGKRVIFLRSVYLQGLLVMEDLQTPEHLQSVVPVRSKLKNIAQNAGMNIQEMALRYGLGLKGCSSVVIGVESFEQMKANIDVMEKGALPNDVLRAIDAAVPLFGEDILLPVNWKKEKFSK